MADLKDLRVHAHSAIAEELGGLEESLRERGVSVVSRSSGALQNVLDPIARSAADVLVFDSPGGMEQSAQLLTDVLARFPTLDILARTTEVTVDALRAGLRAGVREVIALGAGTAELEAALGRIASRRQAGRAYSARVSAFISCKGGSGATFTAANLGYALAEASGKRVILIDLNLQFGDAVLYLSDRRPASSVADLIKDAKRLDGALLQSSSVQVLPNFWVLPAPADPVAAAEVTTDAVQALLKFVRSQADYVIVDLGRALDAASVQVLDLADHVYPVLQQTLPYIRDGKRMIDVFRSLGYPADKIRPVLSRYQANAEITESDLEDALGIKIFVNIPNEYKVASSSVNQGIPVWKLARASAIGRGLSEFVSRLDAPVTQQVPWFKRLLQRG
jgi:pilus assembly protein CpaE